MLRKGRAAGWERPEYVVALGKEVMLPMAEQIEARLGEKFFSEDDIRKATSRVLRMGYAFNGS